LYNNTSAQSYLPIFPVEKKTNGNEKNGKTSTDSIQFEVTRISCQTYALDVAFCLATILSKLLTAETVPLKLLL